MAQIDKTSQRRVKQLSPEVARKIAAGEVIDRPNAIVRELLDNAVDSGADKISVEINGGGIEKIRVLDNGSGMTKEDLIECAHPHATSKIAKASDLMNLTTLGFRGEALASIAAVSRLSIASGNYKMRASITEDHILEQIPTVQNGKGTIVSSEGLFENYPARRVFLKRPASENLMCRETFVEKSLPRTDISFRLTIDNELRLDLPKDVTPAERFVSALELKENPENFALLKAGDGQEWSFSLVIGEPFIYRNDRKQIFIYVNGRRVQEYSLIQAIEYGCQGFFPNGTHPIAALFAEVEPSLVDFNIHPAKKEVRFKDSSALHHGISSTLKEYFRSYGIKNSKTSDTSEETENAEVSGFDFEDYVDKRESYIVKETATPAFSQKKSGGDFRSLFFNYDKASVKNTFQNSHTASLASQALNYATPPKNNVNSSDEPQFTIEDKNGFAFIGTVLNCFLVVQLKNTVYFIDQHAAHERIIFDSLLSKKVETQNLLIPYKIQTKSDEEEKYIDSCLPKLKEAGFSGINTGDGLFEFSTVPSRWKGSESDFENALLEKIVDPKDLIYSVIAMTACKAAVKDGYILDREAAIDLAKKALSLPDPHCPHGRPVWTTLSKEQLFDRVRRTR